MPVTRRVSLSSAALALVLAPNLAVTQDFSASELTGAFNEEFLAEADGTIRDTSGGPPSTSGGGQYDPTGPEITLQSFTKKTDLVHVCGCRNDAFEFDMGDYQALRGLSDRYLAGGRMPSRYGWSNAVWSWGQFIDHDVVATVDDTDGHEFDISMGYGGDSGVMTLHRLVVEPSGQWNGKCRTPPSVISPHVDGSMVYGSDEQYLQNVLRKPGTCFLRTSEGDLLPVTSKRDAAGIHRFVAGDGRVNEHAILTTMHTTWMREHNRLCRIMGENPTFADMSADEKFTRARQVVIAKLQHITVKHFLPTLGISEQELRSFTPMRDDAKMGVEFSVCYRMGHDLIPDNVGPFAVKDIFQGERYFGINSAAGAADPAKANADMKALVNAVATSRANDLDGKFADSLRNFLFGAHPGRKFGEDLATRNMFRSRDVGMMDYEGLAKCYGVKPISTLVRQAQTAMDDVTVAALLKENPMWPQKPFGPVNSAILTDQFHRLFFGKEGLYWENTPGNVEGFEHDIRNCTLGKVYNDNIGTNVVGDVFRA